MKVAFLASGNENRVHQVRIVLSNRTSVSVWTMTGCSVDRQRQRGSQGGSCCYCSPGTNTALVCLHSIFISLCMLCTPRGHFVVLVLLTQAQRCCRLLLASHTAHNHCEAVKIHLYIVYNDLTGLLNLWLSCSSVYNRENVVNQFIIINSPLKIRELYSISWRTLLLPLIENFGFHIICLLLALINLFINWTIIEKDWKTLIYFVTQIRNY